MRTETVHWPNGRGGTICLSNKITPLLTTDRDKMTCASCLRELDYKRKSPEQMNRQRRMAGKRAAKNPEVLKKFGARIMSGW